MKNLLLVKANAAIRYLLVHGFSSKMPYYIVTEYPRSGGTWVGTMLSQYLEVPFPRNRIPVFKPSIIHGHYLYGKGISNAFCVLRDGRDVMASMYFFSLHSNNMFNRLLVKKTKKRLNIEDIHQVRENLPAFLNYKFTVMRTPRFRWDRFIEDWLDREGVGFIRYENLLQTPLEELTAALENVLGEGVDTGRLQEVIDNCTFEKMAGRKAGQENRSNFMRKGIAGDWKNYFSRESAEIFDHYAGKALIAAGYETNSDWVRSVPDGT